MKKHAADTLAATIVSAALIATLSSTAVFGAPSESDSSAVHDTDVALVSAQPPTSGETPGARTENVEH